VNAERFSFQEWRGCCRRSRTFRSTRFDTTLKGPLAAMLTDLDLTSNWRQRAAGS
jgi:hypothetical protein